MYDAQVELHFNGNRRSKYLFTGVAGWGGGSGVGRVRGMVSLSVSGPCYSLGGLCLMPYSFGGVSVWSHVRSVGGCLS